MLYALVLIAWHAHSPADVYIVDHSLTGEDCTTELTDPPPLHQARPPHSTLACMLDDSLPLRGR